MIKICAMIKLAGKIMQQNRFFDFLTAVFSFRFIRLQNIFNCWPARV